MAGKALGGRLAGSGHVQCKGRRKEKDSDGWGKRDVERESERDKDQKDAGGRVRAGVRSRNDERSGWKTTFPFCLISSLGRVDLCVLQSAKSQFPQTKGA